MRFKLPLTIFILMVGLLAYGLGLDPKKVPSPLIDSLRFGSRSKEGAFAADR